MDAFGIIAKTLDDIHLILAGYEFNKTIELFERLPSNVRNRVHYKGFVTGDEKLNLLSQAKIFVMPSRHEAHPVSVLEALGCGKAVIVSDIPEFGYIEENGIGIAFQNGSPEDLSKKLCLLLKDKTLRRSLGDKGRKYASQFLWDDLALKFEDFLAKVVYKKYF
jgi:glycosyltransferase involved in cell wall biosynthesis